MSDYYNRDGTPVQGATREEIVVNWAKKYETEDRHVGDSTIGDLRVSTVFLGLDHSFGGGPPLIFETMVFGQNGSDLFCEAVVKSIIEGTFKDYGGADVDTTFVITEEPTLI